MHNVLTETGSMGELLNRFFASVYSKEQGHGDRNVARGEDDQAGVGGGGGEGISVVITDYGSDGERAFGKIG